MTLALALKEKNRMLRTINTLKQRIQKHNSVLKGNQPIYDTRALYKELVETANNFATLKANITKANQPILEKIYRLNELRSLIAFLKYLDTKNGTTVEGGYNSNAYEWKANIKATEVDAFIENIEQEIDQTQNEIDLFNFQTTL